MSFDDERANQCSTPQRNETNARTDDRRWRVVFVMYRYWWKNCLVRLKSLRVFWNAQYKRLNRTSVSSDVPCSSKRSFHSRMPDSDHLIIDCSPIFKSIRLVSYLFSYFISSRVMYINSKEKMITKKKQSDKFFWAGSLISKRIELNGHKQWKWSYR